jgi:hypothetical protein
MVNSTGTDLPREMCMTNMPISARLPGAAARGSVTAVAPPGSTTWAGDAAASDFASRLHDAAGIGGKAGARAPAATQAPVPLDPAGPKVEPAPPSPAGTQMVYVFDEQLHKTLVKILDVITQRVMANPPAQTTGSTSAAFLSSTGVGAFVDTTA